MTTREANLAGKCKLKVERMDKVGDRIFIARQ